MYLTDKYVDLNCACAVSGLGIVGSRVQRNSCVSPLELHRIIRAVNRGFILIDPGAACIYYITTRCPHFHTILNNSALCLGTTPGQSWAHNPLAQIRSELKCSQWHNPINSVWLLELPACHVKSSKRENLTAMIKFIPDYQDGWLV